MPSYRSSGVSGCPWQCTWPLIPFRGWFTTDEEQTTFRSALTQAGIDSSLYSGHSFRIGAASTAAANGVVDSLIQTLGRWKSSAYLAYIKIPSENLSAISRRICKNS